jgi:HEAT repeat protein
MRLGRVALVMALFLACQSRNAAVDKCIDDAKYGDVSERRIAVSRLGTLCINLGNKDLLRSAIAALEMSLTDPDPDVRSEAADSLGSIGAPAQDSLVPLAGNLRDESLAARTNAAAGIYRIAEALNGEISGNDREVVVRELVVTVQDKDRYVRAHVVRGLAAVAPDDRAVMDLIAVKTADSDPNVRAQAARGLGASGRDGERYMPVLRELLDDQDETVRDNAMRAIREMEKEKR